MNGEKRQYYKTNAIFRSILLEPGKHRLEFVFGPKAVATGLWLSGVTFLGLAVLLVVGIRRESRAL